MDECVVTVQNGPAIFTPLSDKQNSNLLPPSFISLVYKTESALIRRPPGQRFCLISFCLFFILERNVVEPLMKISSRENKQCCWKK